jgi:hypothetical protein
MHVQRPAAGASGAHPEVAVLLCEPLRERGGLVLRRDADLVLAHHRHDARLLARRRAAHHNCHAERAQACERPLRILVLQNVRQRLAVNHQLRRLQRVALRQRAVVKLHATTHVIPLRNDTQWRVLCSECVAHGLARWCSTRCTVRHTQLCTAVLRHSRMRAIACSHRAARRRGCQGRAHMLHAIRGFSLGRRVADEQVVSVVEEAAGHGDVDRSLLLVASDHPDLDARVDHLGDALGHLIL